MSAIQFLREKAGALVAFVIGFSLLLFVISDLAGGRGNQSRKVKKYYEIGEIAGETVSYQDFETRVQSLVEVYKLSGLTVDETMYTTIRENIWEQMVREKILDNQYEDLGIGVSVDELDDLVLGDNPHAIVLQLFTDQSTGLFNKSYLVNFLKQIELDESARTYWLFFEDEIVNDRSNTKYNNLVSKGLYVTSKSAEFNNLLNEATVDFSFIMKNYSSIADSSITISNREIEDYYSKNKDNYKRTANRDIEYVSFDIVPSEEDSKETEMWVADNIDDFKAATDPVQFINVTADTRYDGFFVNLENVPSVLKEFVQSGDQSEVFGPYEDNGSFKIARIIEIANRPDSVQARHILLSSGTSIEAVQAIADSLVGVIKSGNESFESIAIKYSEDSGSAQLGGDLGWFEEGMMVTAFNDACFTGKKGDIVTVESEYGVHIIEILNQSKAVTKYKIGEVDRQVVASSATTQNIYSQASLFAGNYNSYDKFNNGIAELGLNKRVATAVTPDQKTLPGLESPRSLVISLFNTEEGGIILDDSQQAVFELEDKYVVAFCTKIQEEGFAPVEDVNSDIRFALIVEKKAEMIEKEFVVSDAKSKTIDALARETGLTLVDAAQTNFSSYYVAGAGNEPALIAAASASKEGVTSGPVKGNNGVFMLAVNSVVKTPAQDIELIKQNLTYTYQMRGAYEAYEALKDDAGIVDQRYKFY